MAVFDTETTDADPLKARLVSAYLGLLDADGNILREQEWIMRPQGFVIPDGAIAIHGITNERALAEGQFSTTVLGQIIHIIQAACIDGGLPLVGQNVGYDLNVLHEEWRREYVEIRGDHGPLTEFIGQLHVLDSLVLDKRLVKYRKGPKARVLINLAKHYGIHLTEEEAHGARADALAAGRIVLKQFRDDLLRGMPLDVVHEAQAAWYSEQAADLENWFRTKAPADRRDPAFVADRGWPLHSSLTQSTKSEVTA